MNYTVWQSLVALGRAGTSIQTHSFLQGARFFWIKKLFFWFMPWCLVYQSLELSVGTFLALKILGILSYTPQRSTWTDVSQKIRRERTCLQNLGLHDNMAKGFYLTYNTESWSMSKGMAKPRCVWWSCPCSMKNKKQSLNSKYDIMSSSRGPTSFIWDP